MALRKRRGPLGCLFKFVFTIVFFVVAIVGVIAFMFYDGKNNTPVELYGEGINLEEELTLSLYEALDNLDTQNKIQVVLTEDQINKIIYMIIKESINPAYAPGEGCTTSACANAMVIGPLGDEIPQLAGQEAYIKGIYAEIIDGKISINMPVEVMGFKSRIYLSVSVVTVGTNIELRFDSVGIAKIKLTSGVGQMLLQPVMQTFNLSADEINQNLAEKGLPIEFDMANLKMVFKQEDLPQVINQLLPDSEESNLMKDFLKVMIENTNVEMSLVGSTTPGAGSLNLGIDLEKLSLEEGNKQIPAYLGTPFNQTTFVTNQTHGLLFSTLVGNPRFIFLESDFNKMIYSSTNGFDGFGQTITLPNSTQTVTFGLDALWFEITQTNVNIIAQVNINGFITRFRILTTVEDNDTDYVKLMIQDNLDIGFDLGEVLGEYGVADSQFLIDLIGPSIQSMNVMGYDSTINAFILDANAFNQMLNLGGTGGSPIGADSIHIRNGRIEIAMSTTDSALSDAINNLSNIVGTVLTGFDTTVNDNINLFDTTGDQADAVNNIIDTLESISTVLNDPEADLSEDDIVTLIENFGSLSPENQEVLAELLQNEADDIESGELNELYELLFGQQP